MIDSITSHQVKYQASSQAISQFSIHFNSYLKNALNILQKNTNIANHSWNSSNSFSAEDISNDTLLNIIDEAVVDTNLVVKINAMCILYHQLFGNLDQKLFAAVIESNTKVF